MPDNSVGALTIKSDNSEKEEDKPIVMEGSLDDTCYTIAKNAKPVERGKLNEETISRFEALLSRGTPMSQCALYIGVPITTVTKWYKDGQDEVDRIPDDMIIDSENGLESLVSLKGKFYLRCCAARAKPVIDLQDMLYEKAFESGKEWIATYILERMLPETYNLKYKVQQEVNSNVNANVVQFQFVDGIEARSEEDREYLHNTLEDLKEKYANNDIIDVTPIDDTEDEE